jgi:hypothetical protein
VSSCYTFYDFFCFRCYYLKCVLMSYFSSFFYSSYMWQEGVFTGVVGKNYSCVPSQAFPIIILDVAKMVIRFILLMVYMTTFKNLYNYMHVLKPWIKSRTDLQDHLLVAHKTGAESLLHTAWDSVSKTEDDNIQQLTTVSKAMILHPAEMKAPLRQALKLASLASMDDLAKHSQEMVPALMVMMAGGSVHDIPHEMLAIWTDTFKTFFSLTMAQLTMSARAVSLEAKATGGTDIADVKIDMDDTEALKQKLMANAARLQEKMANLNHAADDKDDADDDDDADVDADPAGAKQAKRIEQAKTVGSYLLKGGATRAKAAIHTAKNSKLAHDAGDAATHAKSSVQKKLHQHEQAAPSAEGSAHAAAQLASVMKALQSHGISQQEMLVVLTQQHQQEQQQQQREEEEEVEQQQETTSSLSAPSHAAAAVVDTPTDFFDTATSTSVKNAVAGVELD